MAAKEFRWGFPVRMRNSWLAKAGTGSSTRGQASKKVHFKQAVHTSIEVKIQTKIVLRYNLVDTYLLLTLLLVCALQFL